MAAKYHSSLNCLLSYYENHLSRLLLFIYLFILRYVGLSLLWPLLLQSTGSGRAGSAAMAHGPSRSEACGILPDRGTHPRTLHRQADSQPPRHQGSPRLTFLIYFSFVLHLVSPAHRRPWAEALPSALQSVWCDSTSASGLSGEARRGTLNSRWRRWRAVCKDAAPGTWIWSLSCTAAPAQ